MAAQQGIIHGVSSILQKFHHIILASCPYFSETRTPSISVTILRFLIWPSNQHGANSTPSCLWAYQSCVIYYIRFLFDRVNETRTKFRHVDLSIPRNFHSVCYVILCSASKEIQSLPHARTPFMRLLTWTFNILQSRNCPSLKCAFRRCVFFGKGGWGIGKIITIPWVWA